MALAVGAQDQAALQERAPQDKKDKETGRLVGDARDAKGQLLPDAKVRVRDLATGAVAAEAVATSAGTFSIAGLLPASYVVEIVGASGQVIGISSAIAVVAGTTTTVTVTAAAIGAVAAAAGAGGFSILGLGTAASVAVAGAAATAAVAGVVAAANRPTASPSQ